MRIKRAKKLFTSSFSMRANHLPVRNKSGTKLESMQRLVMSQSERVKEPRIVIMIELFSVTSVNGVWKTPFANHDISSLVGSRSAYVKKAAVFFQNKPSPSTSPKLKVLRNLWFFVRKNYKGIPEKSEKKHPLNQSQDIFMILSNVPKNVAKKNYKSKLAHA